MSEFDFDLFVIGAGSGGVRLARMSASKGVRVAVAENRYLGGTCVNVGCVPKKLMVYASHFPEEMEDAAGFGFDSPERMTFSWETLVANKNREISRLNGIYEHLLENSGAQIFHGAAKVIGPNSVVINGEQYTAERIVVATGGWPRKLDIKGAEHVATSNEFFFLKTLPKTAVVLGGGYIALELAGILNGLGVETTVIYRGAKVLRGFDEEIRDFVVEQIREKGVKFLLNDNLEEVSKNDNGNERGGFEIKLESGKVLETGLVLSAIGRTPLTQGLGLEEVGVELGRSGEVKVDAEFRTNVPSIYAIGDVINRVQLTPVALAEGMYLSRLFYDDLKPEPLDYHNIPTAVFCQPNIGTVGLTEEVARQQLGKINVYVSSFRPMKHTMSGRNERSLMKLVVDAVTDRVVGAHMVGPDAGEIIQGIAIAIKAGATKQVFDSTIGIHPTAAEEFVTLREPRL